jgi:hypothetical protein
MWPAFVRVSLLGASLVGLAAVSNMACEDKAIGRPCDILADAGPTQAVYNAQALECPTRICLKPLYGEAANGARDTGAYCSAECSKDSDCEGQKRDGKDPTDKRCETGYACGVAFVVGPLCCKKVCICKDFLGSAGISTPLTCEKSGGKNSCAENL